MNTIWNYWVCRILDWIWVDWLWTGFMLTLKAFKENTAQVCQYNAKYKHISQYSNNVLTITTLWIDGKLVDELLALIVWMLLKKGRIRIEIFTVWLNQWTNLKYIISINADKWLSDLRGCLIDRPVKNSTGMCDY